MLTRLIVRNFKQLREIDIPLSQPVVFIGPNNSGKTTALQALALWDIGVRAWSSRRSADAKPEKRPGITINRRDLVNVPVPSAKLLWKDSHVRDSIKENGKARTLNVRMEVLVEGANHSAWTCGVEFDYSNEESLVCRPIRQSGFDDSRVAGAKFTEIPEEAKKVTLAYLPPMSGLAEREFMKQQGEIDFLIGQGQTADILRNLCFQVSHKSPQVWEWISSHLGSLFGVKLHSPEFIAERSEIRLVYDQGKTELDISSAGRGFQQTLLLLTHIAANPGAILLLDEPDAHLEVLRQRQVFNLISDAAAESGAQIIAASHSEVVLNEAAQRGTVVAFVGKPHAINNKSPQVVKSLTEIGWDLYYQAEMQGWVLFLEGSTDLAILQAFAKTLEHPVREKLQRPFVHYVSTDHPTPARRLFYGLLEACPKLVGFALFDRIESKLENDGPLIERCWTQREIENYLCQRDVLLEWASGRKSLFSNSDRIIMDQKIHDLEDALKTLGKPSPWKSDLKVTDEFLDPLFKKYFQEKGLPLTMRKSDYHELASLVPRDRIDQEVVDVLDAILETANRAVTPP